MNRKMIIGQLIVIAIITVLVVGYAMFNLLGVRITNKPFKVTVQLKTAGGLFDGSEVNYRGVHVGRVTGVDLKTSQVIATLAIDHGTKVPDNAIAHVYDLSAVGEQYIDLVPTGPSSTYLRSGSVIPAARTTTPLQTATVLYDLQQFVNSIDPQDVQIIGREGALAFGGNGQQLKSLLENATSIVRQLSSVQGPTIDLIHNAAILLHTAAAHGSDFDVFAKSLQSLSGTLASSTPTLEKFFEQAEPTTRLFNTLIADNASAVSVLLGNLASLSEIQVVRLPGLKTVLVAVPAFGALLPKAVHGDSLFGAGNVNLDQALCPTGVKLTNPLSGQRSQVQHVQCSAINLIRGAANAPQPGGSAAASALSSTDGQVQVGSYDTASGLTSTSDGTTIRLGMDGGQEQILGANSWQAMLLALTGS